MSELDEYMTEQAENDASDLSHQLATESSDAVTKPEGSPTFVPPASLTALYDTRAQFFHELAGVDMGMLSSVVSGGVSLEDVGMSFTIMDAFMSSIAASMRAMRIVCPDKAAFDRWAKGATDEDRMACLFWYLQEMQPGEAPASPN